MEFRGTVQGEAARKYAGYHYRKAVMQKLTLFSVDPDRLDPMHEYPRFCPPPNQTAAIETIDLADYVVKFGRAGPDGMSPAEVWMLPNEYTAEQAPGLAFRCHVAHAFILRHQYVDEVLKMAFRPR